MHLTRVSPGYKMKVNKNLAIKNFTAGTCRRQRLGAEVTGRTSWPGLNTSKNHAKISQLLISFKRIRI